MSPQWSPFLLYFVFVNVFGLVNSWNYSFVGLLSPFQHTFTSTTFQQDCAALADTIKIPDVTVNFAQFVPANTSLVFPDSDPTCRPTSQMVYSDICRIAIFQSTSVRSNISFELWLPKDWTGRFMSLGNSGFQGCIHYDELAYTSSLGFASVSGNGGHNGSSTISFLHNPDVIADFSYRSVHAGTVTGKALTKRFYGKPHTKSYYFGCSTGGRQAWKSVQSFPEDFDGVVAAAPAFDLNNLQSWSARFYHLNGPVGSPTFVPLHMWTVIQEEILKQCDELDGAKDGILEDPNLCQLRPEALICSEGNTKDCLTGIQAATVREIFSPYYGLNGTLLYPRLQPGFQVQMAPIYFNGTLFPFSTWFAHAIYSDPTWNATLFNSTSAALANTLDPAGISSFSPNLSRFRALGGKVLHYHGLEDMLISSDISARYYDLVSRTMNLPSAELDAFYRYFRISGMGHCGGGPGAWSIGQGLDMREQWTQGPEDNVIWAIVRWVEEGVPPEYVRGIKWMDDVEGGEVVLRRRHCRYPMRNVYVGKGGFRDQESWQCV